MKTLLSDAHTDDERLRTSPQLTAVCGLVGSVATVVLCVALPPEGDTLVVFADKLMTNGKQYILVSLTGVKISINWLDEKSNGPNSLVAQDGAGELQGCRP